MGGFHKLIPSRCHSTKNSLVCVVKRIILNSKIENDLGEMTFLFYFFNYMLGQVDANHPAVVAPEHEVKQEVGACTYMV